MKVITQFISVLMLVCLHKLPWSQQHQQMFVVLKTYNETSLEGLHVHIFTFSVGVIFILVCRWVLVCVYVYHDVLMCHINTDWDGFCSFHNLGSTRSHFKPLYDRLCARMRCVTVSRVHGEDTLLCADRSVGACYLSPILIWRWRMLAWSSVADRLQGKHAIIL